MFGTEAEAKDFLVERIVAQAEMERTPLSAAQRWMLSVSETDRDFGGDPAVAEWEAEISPAEYEEKIAGLLARAYACDHGSVAADLYHEARSRLPEGDYYLLAMVERALAAPRGTKRALMHIGGFIVLALPGLIALLMAAALAWGAFVTYKSSGQQATSMAVFAVFLGYGGVFLLQLWRKGPR